MKIYKIVIIVSILAIVTIIPIQGDIPPMPTFEKIIIGGSTIKAHNTYDNFSLIAGSGITLTPDTIHNTITLTSSGGSGSSLINYTLPSNPSSISNTTGVMSNLFATFTPTTNGKILVQICGGMNSNTAGDGAGFDIRYGTSLISEGNAIGNSLAGNEQITTSSTASKFESACSIAYVSGLTSNTKYYFQIGKYAVTGGTAGFQNFETYIEEK